jgi:hypothetical protein
MEWNFENRKLNRHLINTKVGICGCGDPGAAWEIMRLLLERSAALHPPDLRDKSNWTMQDHFKDFSVGMAAALRGEGNKAPSFYDKAEDASERWVHFGAHILDNSDLLEHGTGIGFAWLTDEGKLLLEFLREFGTYPGTFGEDDAPWPSWAFDYSEESDLSTHQD